jgi:tRNA (mo5U34)-methyltransferase
MKDDAESRRTGTRIPPPHESRHWKPGELPGRRPFDAARRILGSRVEPVVGDFKTIDPGIIGTFDVVLFLGVIYHLEDPLTALIRVRDLVAPGGLAVVETEAVELMGQHERICCEFIPGQELNNDPTNWWIPNGPALKGLCESAGFREVELLDRASPPALWDRIRAAAELVWTGHATLNMHRYRLIAQARK